MDRTGHDVITICSGIAGLRAATEAAVVFLVIAGVLLWFSRVNKRLGKELLEGGVIIGLFIEFVVPVLMSIHY